MSHKVSRLETLVSTPSPFGIQQQPQTAFPFGVQQQTSVGGSSPFFAKSATHSFSKSSPKEDNVPK